LGIAHIQVSPYIGTHNVAEDSQVLGLLEVPIVPVTARDIFVNLEKLFSKVLPFTVKTFFTTTIINGI